MLSSGCSRPAPRPPAPLSGGAAWAPRGAALQTQPGTGWPTAPQPGPPPPARRALPARPPRPPPARPPRPSAPTSPDPKFWRRGKVPGERAGGRAAAPGARASLRLPQVHPTGCRRRRRSCRGVLGAAARRLASESGNRKCGERARAGLRRRGAYLAGSPAARACVWLALRRQSGVLYGKVERSSRSRSASAPLYAAPHTVHATREPANTHFIEGGLPLARALTDSPRGHTGGPLHPNTRAHTHISQRHTKIITFSIFQCSGPVGSRRGTGRKAQQSEGWAEDPECAKLQGLKLVSI